jgi:hypothetical protein
MNNSMEYRKSERGSAGTNALIVIAILVLIGNAGLNYVPTAYEGANLKQEMQTIVVQSSALPNTTTKPTDVVKNRLQKVFSENNIPVDALVEVKQNGGVVQARVAYNKSVNILPFGIYKYNYQFDHTAVPAGFLTKDSVKTN